MTSSPTYIKLSTKQFPFYYEDTITDPIGTEDFALVTWVDPPEITELQRHVQDDPVLIDNIWYRSWKIRDATQEELDFLSNTGSA